MTEATKKIVPEMYIQGMIPMMTAMKSTLEPEDLAGTAVFFACDDAKFVTGQTLVRRRRPACPPDTARLESPRPFRRGA